MRGLGPLGLRGPVHSVKKKKEEEEEDEKNILQYGRGPLICLWRIGLCGAKFHFVDDSALFNSGAKKEKKRKEEESCPQVDLPQ